jgi:hypothetical protein
MINHGLLKKSITIYKKKSVHSIANIRLDDYFHWTLNTGWPMVGLSRRLPKKSLSEERQYKFHLRMWGTARRAPTIGQPFR